MAEICSFCKRVVTNNVCCDYCGTPIIFSDFNTEDESDAIDNNDKTLKTSDELDKTLENEQNFNEQDNSFDDIKINIYNSSEKSEERYDEGDTKKISSSDIKQALESAEIDKSDESDENNQDEEEKKLENNSCDEPDLESEDNENEENVLQNENTEAENSGGEESDEKDYFSTENNEEDISDNVVHIVNNQGVAQQKEHYKGDTKLTKFLKNTLGVMFLFGLVSLFFPALSPTELTPSLSFSIIDVVLLIATTVGMCLSFFEKNGIRKFIFGIIFSIIFLAVNIILVRPFPPANAKETVVLAYLAIMLVISLFGHMSDRHTTLEKMQIWFDSFNYVVFFINLFAIALSIMVWIIIPDNMTDGIKPYLIGIIAICTVAILAIFLMFKRKIAGANLFMLTSILIIILSMVAYHNIMDTIGYYNSVINLMNVIGSYYSKFIALLVAFPIIMFLSLSALNKKSEKVRQ